ncbi:phosphomevalonate kinase [Pediococcus cellicola]|uniref:phosphomevalonate kinase n=1 Tax=Pediococcus cellicola TaxID=319652 RepID=UPI0007104A55|nr:phosphomevalonate kinase [Pediococcus cellicola]GEL14360.1 phosphomevalonate kinase [Pediococcus cellicola]
MITVKAPGKLYIAGEYAVVESGYPAIIVALNQFVTASIEKTENIGQIVSEQYHENSIYWRRQGSKMVFDNRDNPFHYILSAINLTEEYASNLNKELGLYNLYINSDLDSSDGKKYGLGSSAAVTVATIKALAKFYHLPLTKDSLFKLAAIAHFDVQGNGSLGDIAASVYGGWIAYHSFNREWLSAQRRQTSLMDLLNKPWPGLDIELLDPPAELKLMIGWTGSPASTSHLVDKVALGKVKDQQEYQVFLKESKACLKEMIRGFHDQSIKVIQHQLRVNRKILKKLSNFSHVSIETSTLQEMINDAEQAGGAAKSSGAGGGDCGIVLIDKKLSTRELLKNWQIKGIKQLNFNVHNVTEL